MHRPTTLRHITSPSSKPVSVNLPDQTRLPDPRLHYWSECMRLACKVGATRRTEEGPECIMTTVPCGGEIGCSGVLVDVGAVMFSCEIET